MPDLDIRSFVVQAAVAWIAISGSTFACSDSHAVSNVNQNNTASHSDAGSAVCGNGIAEQGEECDHGDDNSDDEPNACRRNCLLAYCGDGVFDSGEECDYAEMNHDTHANACRTTCVLPFCGDGVTDHQEECDDGADNSDTEPDACRVGCWAPSCGDGVVDPSRGEECDDGPANSNSEPDACREHCVQSYCGDGVADPSSGEECDDGNADNRDGCGSECQLLPFVQPTLVWEIGTAGTGDGEFDQVGDVAVDSQGDIYVCDILNNRVQKLTADGVYLLQWPQASARDIEVDVNDNVYVWGDGEMRKYDSNGNEITSFKGLAFDADQYDSNQFAVSGTGDELAILNIRDDVYNTTPAALITNAGDHFVVRATRSAADFLGQLGMDGPATGQLQQPFAAQYDSAGLLYILDVSANDVQIHDADIYVSDVLSNISAHERTGFAMDHADRLFIRSSGQAVHAYSNDGALHFEFAVAHNQHTIWTSYYLESWHDPGTSTDYLYTNSAYCLRKYSLDIVNF